MLKVSDSYTVESNILTIKATNCKHPYVHIPTYYSLIHSYTYSHIYIHIRIGLAPHYDDVEVFIFQTQGTKLWNSWLPATSAPSSASSSHSTTDSLLSATSEISHFTTPYLPDTHSSDIDRSMLDMNKCIQVQLNTGKIYTCT